MKYYFLPNLGARDGYVTEHGRFAQKNTARSSRSAGGLSLRPVTRRYPQPQTKSGNIGCSILLKHARQELDFKSTNLAKFSVILRQELRKSRGTGILPPLVRVERKAGERAIKILPLREAFAIANVYINAKNSQALKLVFRRFEDKLPAAMDTLYNRYLSGNTKAGKSLDQLFHKLGRMNPRLEIGPHGKPMIKLYSFQNK